MVGTTSMPQKKEHGSLERCVGRLTIALFSVHNENLELSSGNFGSKNRDAVDISDIAGDRMKIRKTVI